MEVGLAARLRESVLQFLREDDYPAYAPSLVPGRRYANGEFYSGLMAIDSTESLGFEELLIELRNKVASLPSVHPSHKTKEVLEIASARLIWKLQSSLMVVPDCYRNFADWLGGADNAIVSFNWDLVAEWCLERSGVPWVYRPANGLVPILKPHGSINWSDFKRRNLIDESDTWQQIADNCQFCTIPDKLFSNPDPDGTNPQLRYMVFPGDPELPKSDKDVELIWRWVKEAITARDAVVFLGYSLPEYDDFAAKLFVETAKGKKIEVYNPSKNHIARFERIFEGVSVKMQDKFENCIYAQPRK